MKYTVIFKDKTVFYTDNENSRHQGFFIIINNISHQYTTDGVNWIDIQDDHL